MGESPRAGIHISVFSRRLFWRRRFVRPAAICFRSSRPMSARSSVVRSSRSRRRHRALMKLFRDIRHPGKHRCQPRSQRHQGDRADHLPEFDHECGRHLKAAEWRCRASSAGDCMSTLFMRLPPVYSAPGRCLPRRAQLAVAAKARRPGCAPRPQDAPSVRQSAAGVSTASSSAGALPNKSATAERVDRRLSSWLLTTVSCISE